MLYSGRLLHKSVDWMKMHSGKLGTMPHSWISIYVVHFVTAWSVKYISFIHSALWEREEGPNPFLPARDHLWRAGESGRVKKGVEDIVSLLNRKLHNICSFAYRGGVNGQLCLTVCLCAESAASSPTTWHYSLFHNFFIFQRNGLSLLSHHFL